MDREAFSNRFTNYLNCCLFCLPRPPFWVLRQTSEEHFQNKKSSSYRRMHVCLSDTRGTVHCSQAFIPPFNPQPFDLGSQKALGPAGFARLSPAADLIRGVIPLLRWVLRGDRISSAPKCFLFLPLFIFFPSLGGLCLSIRGPTHAPCHVLPAERQRRAGRRRR